MKANIFIIIGFFLVSSASAQMLLDPQEGFSQKEQQTINWALDLNTSYSSNLTQMQNLNPGIFSLTGTLEIQGVEQWGMTPWLKLNASYINLQNKPSETSLDLKSAGILYTKGPVDLEAGLTTLAWGRADGYNPTDFFTPVDMSSRNLEPEESRNAQGLFRMQYFFSLWNLEAVFQPFPVAPVLFVEPQLPAPLQLTLKPAMIPDIPRSGLKINLEPGSWDGSLSIVYGPSTKPAILLKGSAPNYNIQPYSPIVLKTGFDFSTTLINLGLRGEGVWMFPMENAEESPKPDGEAILGLDGNLGNLSWNLNQIVHYTPEGEEPIGLEITPLIYDQTREWNHSSSARLTYSFAYETWRFETLGKYSWNSEEVLAAVFLTWDAPQGNTFRIGGRKAWGPENTLAQMAEDVLSWFLIEWTVSR